MSSKSEIHFTVYYNGEKHELQTFYGEYRNLMALLYDKLYTEGFGECKGMGRCGTCVVKVKGPFITVNTLQRNEESTLNKIGLRGYNMRLACQIEVDEKLKNVIVQIIGSESI